MEDKTTIKTNPDFEYYEQEALLDYLRIMAEKGCILTKADNHFVFEKGNCEKVFYSVNYYNPSSGSIEDFLKNYSEKGYEYLGVYSSIYVFSSSEINTDINETDRKVYYKVLQKKIAGKVLMFLLTIPILYFVFSIGAGEIWYSNSLLIFSCLLLLVGLRDILDFIWACHYMIHERKLIRHEDERDDFSFNKYKKRKASLKIIPVILAVIWMSLGLTAMIHTGSLMGFIAFVTFLFAFVRIFISSKTEGEKIFGREPGNHLKMIRNIITIFCIAGLVFIFALDAIAYYQNKLYNEDELTSYVNENEIPKTIKWESVFGEKNKGIIIIEDEESKSLKKISYSIYESSYNFVIKSKFQTNKYLSYETADPKDWGAQDYKKAEFLPTYPKLVLYPAKVFEYETDGYEPDKETIRKIRDYLDLR